MLKSLNHWVFSFILSQRITNPLTGKMHYHIHYHQSLCLSTADGIPRKTAKSKLEEVVLKEGDSTIVDNPREVVTESKHNAGERESCGCNDEVIIKSTKFKAPNIFKLFCEVVKIRTSSWICFVKQHLALRTGRLSSCKHLPFIFLKRTVVYERSHHK